MDQIHVSVRILRSDARLQSTGAYEQTNLPTLRIRSPRDTKYAGMLEDQ
jgi:hypothetical protein